MEKPRDARGHFIKDTSKTYAVPIVPKRARAKKETETHIYTSIAYMDFEITATSKIDKFALVGISNLVEDALKKMVPVKGCKITDVVVSMLYKEPKVQI